MRTRYGTILVAMVALAVGGAAGWLAAGAWGGGDVLARRLVHRSLGEGGCKYGNMETANDGRAGAPDGRAVRPLAADSKSQRGSDAEVRREPEAAKPEEKPAQEEPEEPQKKVDNPFPRYLDMFKNNPEALVAEFLKEADADRARQAKMRKDVASRLNLSAEQTAVLEKALDDLVAAVTQINQDDVDLVLSGKLNMDTASDGRLWDSNPLWSRRLIAARESAVQETAERLYEQLEFDGISDADAQNAIQRAAYITSFSYECLEPSLYIYDKVYKNMGVGEGVFSWCRRPHPPVGK